MTDRYVLLRHECPDGGKPNHWDLMLESDGALLTWELRQLPDSWLRALDLEPNGNRLGSVVGVPAIRLADHRLEYLNYEGEISDNRGTVQRIDRGDLNWMDCTASQYAVDLKAGKLCGQAILKRESNSWRLEVPR